MKVIDIINELNRKETWIKTIKIEYETGEIKEVDYIMNWEYLLIKR